MPAQQGLRIAKNLTLPLDAITETFAILARRGSGKALALDTPIATPDGWTTMGDLVVGDVILGADGRPTTVTFATEVQHNRECFEVIFSDGSKIIADADHRWLTEDHACRRAVSNRASREKVGRPNLGHGGRPQCERRAFPRVVTTREMVATLIAQTKTGRPLGANHSIRNAEPLDLAEQDLPIDPYLLGVWLGDGVSANAIITTMDPEIENAFVDAGYSLTLLKQQSSGRARSSYIARGSAPKAFHAALRELGVLRAKHIPAQYLRASQDQRMALLAGLMDTDGTAAANTNSAVFTSCNERLAEQVYELIVSLGMSASRRKRTAKIDGIEHGVSHELRFRPRTPEVFRLPRKRDRINLMKTQGSRHERRFVTAINPVSSVPVRCITVDNQDHLFLAGESMIPTHNTYTGAVLAEEIIRAGYPAIIIDPLGVWWGLRSSEDGEGEGLPVVIFGGDHADVPLDAKSGELVADVIVNERISAIIDLSLLTKGAARQFMTAFIGHLYRVNREPAHVLIDEADAFAPQRSATGDAAPLLGAMQDLVRRGRVRGLGVTMITQRPAVLSKDVLTQAGVLIAMRMSGPRDVAAIDEWIRLHADEDEAKTLKSSLPSLPVGTAWVWAPSYPEELVQIAVRRRTTFDSSATPKVGVARLVPKQMARVDLDALGEQIAAAAQAAEENDPKVLKARIRELERGKPAAKPAVEKVVETVVEYRDVPVLSPEQAADLASAREALNAAVQAVESASRTLSTLEGHVDRATSGAVAERPVQAKVTKKAAPSRAGRAAATGAGTTKASTPSPAAASSTGAAGDEVVNVRAGARRMLETLGRNHPMRLTKAQVQTLAKMRTSGTSSTYWSTLRRAGFLDENGTDIGITAAGLEFLGIEPGEPMSSEEVIAQYRTILRAGAVRMFDHLVDCYPNAVTKAEIAEAAGMEVASGTFSTYLSTLRRNGLVEQDGDGLRAAEVLFLNP